MKRKLLFAIVALLCSVGTWADTSLLTEANGWTKITSISQSDIANNYYVFVADDADLMLGIANSTNQSNKALFYQTSVDPVTDLTKVFYLEPNGVNYAMRNVKVDYLQFQTEYSGSSNDLRWRHNDQREAISWTGLGLAYSDGAWTLTSTQYSRPLGIYNNTTGTPAEGNEIGANNAGNGQKFQIYAINRRQFATLMGLQATSDTPADLTGLIFNSDFENTAKTKDYGWTVSSKTAGNYNFNGAVEAWHYGDFDIHQTLNVPNGKYSVKVQTLRSASAFLYAGTKDNKALNAEPGSGSDFATLKNDIANDATLGLISVDVTVSNGQLTFGLADPDNASAWLVFDNFKLYCKGINLSVLADEFTSGNTMEAGQWYSYTIPTDGDYTLSATTLGDIVYAPADQLTTDATSTASSTVALPAGTVYFKSTTSQTLTISYVVPIVENGDYYLYDATNKLFLSRGNKYGTEAAVDMYGVPFTYNNYEKSIRFKDWATTGLFWSGTEYYTDGGSAGQFTFESTTGGVFLYDKTNSKYIKHAASAQTAFDGKSLTQATSSSEAVVWTVLTKAEHDAIVAAYPTDNKTAVITAASLTSETAAASFETWLAANRASKDYTSHVGTAKFTGSIGDWTWHATERTRDGQPAYGTDFAEMFNVTGYIDQTITDLPEGLYKVTVNAFEREKGYADCNTLGAAGWEIVTAYFDANGQSVQLKSWYSERTGTSNPNNTTEAATAFNNDKYKNEVYCYVGPDGNLTLKLAKPSFIWDSWVLFNNVTLTYYDTNVSDEEATAILTEATTTMESPMKHSLYAALSTAKETFDGARTVPNYNALRTAIDNTATSIASYANMYTNYLSPLSTHLATTNFIDESSDGYAEYAGYKASYDNYKTTGADVENATANALSWNSGEKYVTAVTKLFAANWKIGETSALTNNSGFYINNWSTENAGTGDAKDFANPFYEYWVSSGSLATTTLTGTLTGLTANTIYKITANVRVQGSSKVAGSITMQVGDGAETDVTAGNQIGETTRYIGSYSAIGMTDGDGKLTLTFNVAASSNISWLAFRDVNYEAVTTVADAKSYLIARISAASSARKATNEGSGVFQIPAAAGATLATAISTAQRVYDNLSATISEVTTAISDITDAQTTYEGATLNAPDAEKRYSVTIVEDGKAWNGNAITFIAAGRNDMGLYGIKYLAPANTNLNQALKFTAVDGETNTYKVSALNVETGEEQYITTGSTYTGGNNSQIRTTDDASKASWVKIQATATDGQFQLLNVSDGNKVIANNNNNDMYTANSANFTIAEATQASVAVIIAAGKWATRIFPVAPGTIDGITFYSCDAIEGDKVTLAEVATPEANKPYILRSSKAVNTSVSGWGTAGATSYTEGYLTGVYDTQKIAASVDATADADGAYRYVLQTQNEVQAFYKVDAAFTAKANRAYLTVPQAKTGGEVKALFFDFGDETGITETTEKTEGSEAMFDLSGRRVSKAQKGLYIVNGKKVMVK